MKDLTSSMGTLWGHLNKQVWTLALPKLARDFPDKNVIEYEADEDDVGYSPR
jgi:hypothetical protein